MPNKLTELRVFFREFRRNFHSTGAIAPSSRFLAKALARFVAGDGSPRRILEVGPGTGAVTTQIVRRLGPQDRLDLVELNDSFVEVLRQRFSSEPSFRAIADRSRVLHQRVEELPERAAYDVIVSGLPLNNFAAAAVARILAAFAELAKPGGTLSFFEYIAVRPLRSAVSGAAQRQRLKEIGRLLHGLLQQGEIRRDWVLVNVPPAWVHHVRMGERNT
jgi:phosphatidylethanolamine/phosphatidyl-N-methylethanolamine N-methyltransferase